MTFDNIIMLGIIGCIILFVFAVAFSIIDVLFKRNPHKYEFKASFSTGVYHKINDEFVERLVHRYICSKCGKKYDSLDNE